MSVHTLDPWQCPYCEFVNRHDAKECERCSRIRPAIRFDFAPSPPAPWTPQSDPGDEQKSP